MIYLCISLGIIATYYTANLLLYSYQDFKNLLHLYLVFCCTRFCCIRIVALSYSAFFLGCCLVWGCLVDRYPSRASPANTKSDPAHCCELRAFPKYITENKIVKNLRVVVTIEHQSGPNVVTIEKIKYCPNAEQAPRAINHFIHSG